MNMSLILDHFCLIKHLVLLVLALELLLLGLFGLAEGFACGGRHADLEGYALG